MHVHPAVSVVGAGALNDVEHWRCGISDGPTRWINLGTTAGDGCEGN